MTSRCLGKPGFEDAVRRTEAWWAGESVGRPAVCARLAKPDARPRPVDPRPREVCEFDPEWQAGQMEWMLDSCIFGGEDMPGMYPQFGSNLLIPGAIIGAEAEYRPETTWLVEDADIYDRPRPVFQPEHPTLTALVDSLRLMGERFGDRGLLSAPPMLDGLTTLSMLRGPERLCLDLLDRPETVKQWATRLDEIAIEVHRTLSRVVAEFGDVRTVTWAGIYSPGKAEMIQCDFGLMLSEPMFDEFAMSGLAMVCEYMDRSCYHLDGVGQIRFHDLLMSLPKLRAIQWNPEPPAPPALEWVDYFRRVLDDGRSMWVACDAETALQLTKQLGPDGLMLAVRGLTGPDELTELLDALTAASR